MWNIPKGPSVCVSFLVSLVLGYLHPFITSNAFIGDDQVVVIWSCCCMSLVADRSSTGTPWPVGWVWASLSVTISHFFAVLSLLLANSAFNHSSSLPSRSVSVCLVVHLSLSHTFILSLLVVVQYCLEHMGSGNSPAPVSHITTTYILISTLAS